MPRFQLTDEFWSKLHPVLLSNGIYDKSSLRLTVEGILHRLKTGCQWRELPFYYGKWGSIYKRFNEWSKKEKVYLVFKDLVTDPDLETAGIDGSIIQAHQDSCGAPFKQEKAIGKSVGGNTTKVHMACDACGNPLDFIVTEGQVHDSKAAPKLVKILCNAEALVADKGYDDESIRELARKNNTTPYIPRKKNSTIGNDHMDWAIYKERHLIENVFQKIKRKRAISTRYDRLKRNFVSSIALACALLWLPL